MGHISESSVKALLPPHVSPKCFEWHIPSAGAVAPQDLALTLLPQGWHWLASDVFWEQALSSPHPQ